MYNSLQILFISCVLICLSSLAHSQENKKPRARDLGIPFEGKPGQNNAITDIPGVMVGYTTRIEGEGKLIVGKGPVRTGVTIVLPKGRTKERYACGWFSLNGDAEMTGAIYAEEYGTRYGPIGITNTNSIGLVRDAIAKWNQKQFSSQTFNDMVTGYPVVGETWDGDFNDINGFHINEQDVWNAIDAAADGKIKEGNVGGGTGMWLFGFKGGNGTASRTVIIDSVEYTLGILVQANYGSRRDLVVAGVPVGKEMLNEQLPVFDENWTDGSIFIVIATNAPLLPGQLKLIAKRASLGLARTGTYSSEGSGDVFFAFSTTTPQYNEDYTKETWNVLPKWKLNPLFRATVEATEEAIINALVAAETLSGANGNKLYGISHTRLKEILKKYNRLK